MRRATQLIEAQRQQELRARGAVRQVPRELYQLGHRLSSSWESPAPSARHRLPLATRPYPASTQAQAEQELRARGAVLG